MSLTVSIMSGNVNSHPTTSEEANGLATDFVSEGIIGSYTNTSGVAPMTGAFSVNAQGTPDMTVAVGSGVAYVTGTPSSQNSQTFRVYNSASENVTISSNSSGSTKYDWVYIKLDATLLNAPTLAGTTTATLVTSRSTSNSSDDGTPPTYGYPIAVITVANGASSISNSVIRDLRTNANIGAVSGNNTGWISNSLPDVSSVTYNGNRSYNVTFASTVANLLTPGMSVRTTRTVAAPTQCTSLNGTTQAWTKSSPNKLTFTDNFTLEWKGIVNAYGTQVLVSRTTSASDGYKLYLESDGRISIRGQNAGSTFRMATSYQSVPLGKRITIQGSLTMASGTGAIYLDDVLIPSTVTGTAIALVQAGTLSIGADVGGTTLFLNGKTFRYAIYDAVISASTLRASSSQALVGTETNLKCGSNFNGNANDVNTTTPNDLSAVGSATATNADSAFTVDATGTSGGTYDYGIVTKVATTVATIQTCEGCAIPTSGGITTVDLASVKAPFGMPVDKYRWRITCPVIADTTKASPTASTWYYLNISITLPVGVYEYGYDLNGFVQNTTNQPIGYLSLSTSNSTPNDARLTSKFELGTNNSYIGMNQFRITTGSFTSATPLYLLTQAGTASTNVVGTRPTTDVSYGEIYADLAYL